MSIPLGSGTVIVAPPITPVVVVPPTTPQVLAAPPGVATVTTAPLAPTVVTGPSSLFEVVLPVSGPPGPAGPTGPTGPPGGGSGYTHQQTVAAETWTITHNLGYRPGGIIAKDSIGEIVEPATVSWPNTVVVELTFPGHPMSGVAEVS